MNEKTTPPSPSPSYAQDRLNPPYQGDFIPTMNVIPHAPDKANQKSKTRGDTPRKLKPPTNPPDKGGWGQGVGGQGGFIPYNKA